MAQVMTVYMTAAHEEEARALARMLVERRLAACVNVVPAITSYYWWQGALTEDREALILAKTTSDRIDELIAAVRASHSYTVPAITAWPVARGNPEYLRWVEAETAGGQAAAAE